MYGEGIPYFGERNVVKARYMRVVLIRLNPVGGISYDTEMFLSTHRITTVTVHDTSKCWFGRRGYSTHLARSKTSTNTRSDDVPGISMDAIRTRFIGAIEKRSETFMAVRLYVLTV